MLESIVTQKIKKIAEMVIQPGMNEVPLAYLSTLDMPESVKHFFDQEVETWLAEEDIRLGTSERFDFENPEVRMLIDQIMDVLKQYGGFDQPTFHRILERAIKLELNYLIKPHQTLTQFIFKEGPKVTTIEVYNTLKYFFRLTYYKDALTDYFNQKYMQEITEPQFKELISEIDKRAFEANPVEFILKTLKAIIEFSNEGNEEQINTLTSQILISALEDRNFSDYAALVTRAESQGLEAFTLEQLEKMFSSGKTPSEDKEEAAQVVQEEKETVVMEMTSIEEEKPAVEVSDIDVSEVVAPEPVIEEEEEEEDYEEEEEEEEVVTEEAPKEPVPVGGASTQLADQLAGQITGAGPLEELSSMISRRERRTFLKKLFKKDDAGYTDFIDEINSYNSWKDASIAIDDEFYQRQINPYSKEAISFSDICYRRFFPKDRIHAAD